MVVFCTIGGDSAACYMLKYHEERSSYSLLRCWRGQGVTERLYYNDPDLLEFEAVVVAHEATEGRHLVELDRSAFYPKSGGQLHDLGTLNRVPVVDVIEDGPERVVHVLEQPAAEPGETVVGRIDEERRWRHRQQHTAQHILSHLCVKQLGAATVSVHLGEEYGAIELDRATLSAAELADLEEAAQKILRDNLPVEILFLSGEEIDQAPLRKVPQREGKLRVIRIGDLDWSACGGTHCNSTAQVGTVKLVGTETLRGHAVIHFLSGVQAQRDYQHRFDVTQQLSRTLTCHPADLPDKLVKMASEMNESRKQIAALQKQLLPIVADSLAGQVTSVGAASLVAAVVADVDRNQAAGLASRVAGKIKGAAFLLVSGQLVLAVAPDIGLKAGLLARHICQATGLKGGGGDAVAQFGGAVPDQFDSYTHALRDILGDEHGR